MARRAHLIGPVKMLVRIGLHDGIGKIGTETTINSGDIAGILMIAVQVLESARRSSTEGSADCCAGSAAGRAG